MIFKKEGKPVTSHLFDVRDTITAGNGNARKSNEVHDQQMDQKKFGNFDFIGSIIPACSERSNIRNNCYSNYNRSNTEKVEAKQDVVIIKKESFGPQYDNLLSIEVAQDVTIDEVACRIEDYSGDDLTNVCHDASVNGMRHKIAGKMRRVIKNMRKDEISKDPIAMCDFEEALTKVQRSVSSTDIQRHENWS